MRKLNEQLIKELSEGKCVLDNTGNPDKEFLQEIIIAAFPEDYQNNRTANYYSTYTYFGKYTCLDLTFALTDEKNSHTLAGWNKIIPLKDFEIKELTELPENWVVDSKKLQKSQKNILTDWFVKNNQTKFNFGWNDYFHFPAYTNISLLVHTDSKIKEGYTEISFDDFQRLVLNKDMKKYTIEEIKRNRISVRCSSKEEGEKLCKALDSSWNKHDFNSKSDFEICFLERNKVSWQDYYSDIYPGYFVKECNSPKLINFNEVDFEEKSKFTTKDWVNGKCAIEWEEDKKQKIQSFIHQCCPDYMSPVGVYKYYWCKSNREYACRDTTSLPIVKIDDIMEKKIKYYKLKESFESNFCHIAKAMSMDANDWKRSGVDFALNSSLYNRAKSLGILDVWFEPVYEEEKKVVSVNGKFDVEIRDGKIFHKKDDITSFVKELVERFYHSNTFGSYTAEISEIYFKKTGCQQVETRLSDWGNVWNEYKRLNP